MEQTWPDSTLTVLVLDRELIGGDTAQQSVTVNGTRESWDSSLAQDKSTQPPRDQIMPPRAQGTLLARSSQDSLLDKNRLLTRLISSITYTLEEKRKKESTVESLTVRISKRTKGRSY